MRLIAPWALLVFTLVHLALAHRQTLAALAISDKWKAAAGDWEKHAHALELDLEQARADGRTCVAVAQAVAGKCSELERKINQAYEAIFPMSRPVRAIYNCLGIDADGNIVDNSEGGKVPCINNGQGGTGGILLQKKRGTKSK